MTRVPLRFTPVLLPSEGSGTGVLINVQHMCRRLPILSWLNHAKTSRHTSGCFIMTRCFPFIFLRGRRQITALFNPACHSLLSSSFRNIGDSCLIFLNKANLSVSHLIIALGDAGELQPKKHVCAARTGIVFVLFHIALMKQERKTQISVFALPDLLFWQQFCLLKAPYLFVQTLSTAAKHT